MAWDYTDKVKEHFLKPRNVGEIEGADGRGEVGSIVCGDALVLTIKVDKSNDTITDARFKTFGCGSAIASSSALTELIKGKRIEEALKISNEDIASYLGGLPREKMHCSVMGREALEAAVANYRGEQVAGTHEDEGTIVCYCFGVSDQKIERAIRENDLKTVEDVTHYTKAGGGCTSCLGQIEEILTRVRATMEEERAKAPPPAAAKPLTNLQKIQLIQKVIDEEIRPALRRDGGDVNLLDISGNTVQLSFLGACVGCQAARFTAEGVQERLRQLVAPEIVLEVIPT